MVLKTETINSLLRMASGAINSKDKSPEKDDEGNNSRTEVEKLTPDTKMEEVRGTWSSKWDFAFSCVAYAVGLGNVWRFPYLCFKNGGGAFLIPYFFSMIVCGIPLFFLEVSVGQYIGKGGMSVVGQLAPIFKGVGYSAITMVFLENVYYIIVVTWTLFYLFNTFMDFPNLPWSDCSKGNGSWANEKCWNPEDGLNYTDSTPFKLNISQNDTQSPVEQFWKNEVLHASEGINEVGEVQSDLFCFLLLAWIIVYGVIWKGLHNSGKVLWFSAIFPYVILTILCVKALTLEGAMTGLEFLFTPDWARLAESQVWIDGGTQIFFSYGVGIGALLALGSYNKFDHNCHKDAIVVCCINTFTSFFSAVVIFSILGYMAHSKGVEVRTWWSLVLAWPSWSTPRWSSPLPPPPSGPPSSSSCSSLSGSTLSSAEWSPS